MSGFRITLRNYRCFQDMDPARIEILPGRFLALVGPNNSGKSTVLRFFYEFRPLFDKLTSHESFRSLLSKKEPFEFEARGVEDRIESFCNKNDRDLGIHIDFLDQNPRPLTITRLELTIARARPNAVQAKFICPAGVITRAHVHRGGWDFDVGTDGGKEGKLDASSFRAAVDMCAKSLYVGAHRNAITEGQATYFDLQIGTGFINQWNVWKTGGNRAQNIAIQRITSDIADIFGYKRLEINMSANPLTLQVVADSEPFRLRELGDGLAQFAVVLGNVAMRAPKMICIDEPELNLHPSLQTTFLTNLAAYSGGPVLFATHSIGLARSTSETIYSCHKAVAGNKVRAFEQLDNVAEFLGEMSFSTFKDLGADGILLVEGVTEVKAIQQLLRKVGKDQSMVLIPLGGSAMIADGRQAELSELRRLSNNVAVLIDSERDAPGNPIAINRQAFINVCKDLGFKVHATERRALENYFSQSAIDRGLGPGHHELGPFDSLSSAPNGWAKSNNWRIARELEKDDLLATDVGKFLQSV